MCIQLWPGGACGLSGVVCVSSMMMCLLDWNVRGINGFSGVVESYFSMFCNRLLNLYVGKACDNDRMD